MTQIPKDAKGTVSQRAPLSPHWAFVVRLRVDTELEGGRISGQVEHVVSGQAAHFESLDDLLTFMTQMLTQVRARGP